MKRISLFMRHPECSKDCAYAMVHALSSNYQIRIVDENDFNNDSVFQDCDIFAVPGGIGDADTYFNFFNRSRGNRIESFLKQGGYYLGICMGAYWAGSRYLDILDKVEPVQYIKQPNTDIKRSYGTVASVTWKNQQEKMYFYDGCALIGDEEKFKVIARYANNDPMAIIQGRIGLIGCHPEAPEYWFQKPWQYIHKYYNGGRHHDLLLNFVNELTEN